MESTFESLVNSDRYQTTGRCNNIYTGFESLVNSDRYQTKIDDCQNGIKFESLVNSDRYQTQRKFETGVDRLRALLIQIGIKPSRLFGATDPCLRVLLILYVGNNLQM